MSDSQGRMRDFQERITQRLALAQQGSQTANWLAASIAGERYLFPLAQAGEIVPAATISKLPYTKQWFLGVINSRGRIYGVVDLAAYMGQTGVTNEIQKIRPNRQLDISFLGLNTVLGTNVVLCVEKIYGLKTVKDFVDSTLAPLNQPNWLGFLYKDPDSIHWQEINLQRLTQTQAFLSVGVLVEV